MNNEIKEILDSIKEQSEEENWIQLSPEFIQPLLDYITNLQQENEKLEIALQNIQEDYDRRLEENERLKQPQIFIDTQDMEERYGEELYKDYLKKQLEDYKSRCEKAIEYIKEHSTNTYFSMLQADYDMNLDILLNILQNGSEEK